MVNVCDAIMGQGKTTSAITYINEHSDQKFIFITPYLSEAERIKEGCPDLNFVEPSDKIRKYGFRKTEHTKALIKEGRNITTTHQAFKRYTADTLRDIKEKGYTLFIDENVDVLERFDIHPDDIQMAVDSGYIYEDGGSFHINEDIKYKGIAFRDLFSFIKNRELVKLTGDDGTSFFYWVFPPELLTSFKDVFILTYLFDGQSLHHFMEIYDIPYEYIWVHRDSEHGFRFGNTPSEAPEYVHNIKEMITVLDKPSINSIGDDYFALSKNWFSKDAESITELKNNIYNCINNIWRDSSADKKLWGTFNSEYSKLKGLGYSKSFLTFNTKATNAYRDRDKLIYIANIFMNVNERLFYESRGVEIDEDKYALSIMVQWIWRSAIRDGEKIELYIPSKRMRNILINWMNDISKGGNSCE